MSVRFLLVLLPFVLVGCLHAPARTPKPGANFINNSGNWVEVGTDGKPHAVALPLDQVPTGMSRSSIP